MAAVLDDCFVYLSTKYTSQHLSHQNFTQIAVAADTSDGTSYGPEYYKTWLPRGLPNITNIHIQQHQKPENDAANDPEACSRLYDSTLHIIRKRVGEIEVEQKAQKGGVKKPQE